MNRLIAAYWKPVFYFLRAKGHSLHAAEDLTQAFFLRLLERHGLRRADQRRGRFRTFLLAVLVRFLSDQGLRRAPHQQRFEQQLVSVEGLIGGAELTYEPTAGQTPESIFTKRWAAALVENVLQRLRQFYEEEGRATWFEVFSATHVPGQPDQRVSQKELGERFGMTRDQVRYALAVVEKRFKFLLREEVRDQVDSEADIAEEIRELMDLMQR
jgi:RNA polymerase sigma-70 factor (ECF subfamily)